MDIIQVVCIFYIFVSNISAEKPLGGSGSSLKGGDRRPDTLSEERIASDGFTFEDEDGVQR